MTVRAAARLAAQAVMFVLAGAQAATLRSLELLVAEPLQPVAEPLQPAVELDAVGQGAALAEREGAARAARLHVPL